MATTTAPSRAAVTAEPEAAGKRINFGRVAAWAAMIILILITLFPFYWMLRTAFSTSKSLFSDPSSLLPVDFTTGAFQRVLGLATPAEAQAEGGSGAAVNFWLYLRNSVIFATLTDYASQIEGIMEPAMDNVLTGKAPVESLTEANNQVNQLFG
jgi:multiple sugar transport system permease protein